MKKIYLIALLFLSFIYACKKEETKEKDPDPIPADTTPKESIIEIKTSFGTMYMWLYKQTPLHRANFLGLADTGYFDGMTFHRIVKDFVVQGGDPNSKDADPLNDGSGGPGYTIPAEFVDSLKHDYGAIGAARTNNPAKASSGSQFYIVTDVNGEHGLDMGYTVFGKLLSGVDIAYTISTQSKDSKDRPITNITMDVNVVKKTLAQLKSEFNFTP
ncbi:MAG: peptidylprolyl isomerase [Bacteroidia bacterium]|nr:peptidylprolyl isomerase [Bacteroidia bacterium]